MSAFETFLRREAATALRKVAATRAAVERPDATFEQARAFLAACREANVLRTIVEETGHEELYHAIRDAIDAEG